MNNQTAKKCISMILVFSFICSQCYALGPSSVFDAKINPQRSDAKQTEIINAFQALSPTAIGAGSPVAELVRGRVPVRIALSEKLAGKIYSALDTAIGRVPRAHRARFASRLTETQNNLAKNLYLYNAEVEGPGDYLLAFNQGGRIGISEELAERLSPQALGLAIYKVSVPAKADERALFGDFVVKELELAKKGIIAERLAVAAEPQASRAAANGTPKTVLLSHITVSDNEEIMGRTAARQILHDIEQSIKEKSRAVILFASAPSQHSTWKALLECAREDIATGRLDVRKIIAFHMDEYLGLEPGAPQLFGKVLKDSLFNPLGLKPEQIFYFNDRLAYDTAVALREALARGDTETADKLTGRLETEASAHADSIVKKFQEYGGVFDIVVGGIGKHPHVAFNDAPDAKFNDPLTIKVVRLSETSRQQQVDDDEFEKIEDVPTHALTFTLPPILKARKLHIIVPREFKAHAVAQTLDGDITENIPASGLRLPRVLPNVRFYLDKQSASESTVAKTVKHLSRGSRAGETVSNEDAGAIIESIRQTVAASGEKITGFWVTARNKKWGYLYHTGKPGQYFKEHPINEPRAAAGLAGLMLEKNLYYIYVDLKMLQDSYRSDLARVLSTLNAILDRLKNSGHLMSRKTMGFKLPCVKIGDIEVHVGYMIEEEIKGIGITPWDPEKYIEIPSAIPARAATSGETLNREEMDVRAAKFANNLEQVLSDSVITGKQIFLGISTMGTAHKAEVSGLIREVARKLEELGQEDEKWAALLKNLKIEYGTDEELARKAHTALKDGSVFVVAPKASVDRGVYKDIMGEAGADRPWIAAIDDSSADNYLPIFEAATLSFLAYLQSKGLADTAAVKNLYSKISEEPPMPLEEMLKRRIIYLIPRAVAHNYNQRHNLYELAKEAWRAA